MQYQSQPRSAVPSTQLSRGRCRAPPGQPQEAFRRGQGPTCPRRVHRTRRVHRRYSRPSSLRLHFYWLKRRRRKEHVLRRFEKPRRCCARQHPCKVVLHRRPGLGFRPSPQRRLRGPHRHHFVCRGMILGPQAGPRQATGCGETRVHSEPTCHRRGDSHQVRRCAPSSILRE